MGGTLATHLLAEGHPVVGYDPEPARRREHVERGGTAVDSVADAVRDCGLALLSLPNSLVTLEVCREIVAAAPAELLVIDTTTGDPDDTLSGAAMLAGAGVRYVDATVSGNVVNHVLSINRAAIAEGLAVAEKAGLDLSPMFDVLRDSAAYSKAMDIWGTRMIDGDYEPPASRARQSLKDSRLINGHAESIGASHALVEAVRDALVEAVDGGLADADNASVMEVMRRRAGIGRL